MSWRSNVLRSEESRTEHDTNVPSRVETGLEADFDGKLGAVLAQAVELQADAHRAHVRIAVISLALADVARVVPRRNQHLDRMPDQFLAIVAEEPFGVRVHQTNLAFGVDDDRRVGRILEQRKAASRQDPQGRTLLHRPFAKDP